MESEWRGWQPDPFGAHEFRFFADDGKPTMLVRDGRTSAYDPPPDSQNPTDFSYLKVAPGRGPEVGATSQFGYAPVKGGRETPRATSGVRLVVVEPRSVPSGAGPLQPLSRTAKIMYGVILTAMAASAIALAIRHFTGHAAQPRSGSAAPPATTSTRPTQPSTTTSTIAPPASLKPSAAAAAAALIESWASGNRAEALSVATAPAVATLFSAQYSSGLVIDRGCSVAFSPIVCTYGPPGGASPTDPIYEIYSVQAPGGWYVSTARIEN